VKQHRYTVGLVQKSARVVVFQLCLMGLHLDLMRKSLTYALAHLLDHNNGIQPVKVTVPFVSRGFTFRSRYRKRVTYSPAKWRLKRGGRRIKAACSV